MFPLYIYNIFVLYALLFQTGVCPSGHYCPLGTGNPYTHPCLPGRYRNNTLGHSGKACVLCPSRHYCDRLGTHMPSVCPRVGISSILKKLCCYMDEIWWVLFVTGLLLSRRQFCSWTVSWRNLQFTPSSQWWVWVLLLWWRPVLRRCGTHRAIWKLQRALLL